MEAININLGDTKYPLYIGSGLSRNIPKLFEKLGGKGRAYIIIDEYIYTQSSLGMAQLAKDLKAEVFCLKAGKAIKHFLQR